MASASLWGTANATLADPVSPSQTSPWGTAQTTLVDPTPTGTSGWGTASTTLLKAPEWWVRHNSGWVALSFGVVTPDP